MSHLPLLGGLEPLRVKWLSVVIARSYHGGGPYQVNDRGSSGHSFDAARPDTSGPHSCSEHCHLWHIMVSAPPSDPFMVSPGSVLPFSAAISHLARATHRAGGPLAAVHPDANYWGVGLYLTQCLR